MKFVLTVLDIFSRQAYACPISTKQPENVVKAFVKILKQAKCKPKKLHSDRGLEFTSKKFQDFLQSKSIKWYTTNNQEIKCSLLEIWHRTLKNKMFKYFTAKNTTLFTSVARTCKCIQ